MHLGSKTDDVEFVRLAVCGLHVGEHVELQFVPVHDLAHGTAVAFLCAPVFAPGRDRVVRGYRAFRHLSPRELPVLDEAILQHGAWFSRRLADENIHARVCVSVNFETLLWPKGRREYLEALAATAESRKLLIEIHDVPPNTKDSVLAEMVSWLKPHVGRVFVHLSENDSRLVHAGTIGAWGFAASLPQHPTRPTAMAVAKPLARTSAQQDAHSFVDNVADSDALDIMRVTGIDFAAGPIFGSEVVRYDTPHESLVDILGDGAMLRSSAQDRFSIH